MDGLKIDWDDFWLRSFLRNTIRLLNQENTIKVVFTIQLNEVKLAKDEDYIMKFRAVKI